MIGRLNHVAIAVKDMHAATAVYRDTLGAAAPEAAPQPEHGVSTIFIILPNTKIELLEPRQDCEVSGNGTRKAASICFEIDDIEAASNRLVAEGARVPGTGSRKSERMASPFFSSIRRIFAGRLSNSNKGKRP